MSEMMSPKSHNFPLYLSTIIANLLALSCGIAYGWSSPILPKLYSSTDNPLPQRITPFEESWIAGLLSLGAVFGPLFAGPTADKIGRKKTLLLLACPVLASLIILAFAKSVMIFYIARFLQGLGVGGIFMILPMYLIELAEDHNRGFIGCLFSVFLTLGLLFVNVGPQLSVQNFCLTCTLPLIIFIPTFLVYNPESPVYLATLSDQNRLRKSLVKLRNKPVGEIEKEISVLGKTIQDFSENKGGIKELFAFSYLRKGLMITVSLMLIQQFSGISAVLSYMQSIFDATGSGFSPELSSLIVGIIQVLATILLSCLVDRLGRKILFITALISVSLALTTLGVYFYLLDNKFQVESISWLPLVSLVVFIIGYNSGLGGVPWTLMAEVFPPNVKAVAMTLTTSSCFIGASLITLIFPQLILVLGMGGSFWAFAVICVFSICFVYIVLPETKGKSLQEIQDLLGRKH